MALFASAQAFCQSRSISGVVSDDAGPVPSAAVFVKGVAGTGTVTDLDGRYSIRVSDGQTLVFSCMGYADTEILIRGQEHLDVVLAANTEFLDELVVIGYGVQKKSLLTGSISSVKGDRLDKTGVMRADDALAGKVAGVQVLSNSGQPGADVQIYVRGIGTNGTSTPIYIVDGMPVSGIEYLNPDDIESIEILKDAASSAIYGARGGNGVVLITTKRSGEGTWAVSYDYSYGIQNLPRKIDLLTAHEYAIIQNEAAVNGGTAIPFSAEQVAAFHRGTDWQEAILFRNAPVQRHNVRMSTATGRSSFSASASYLDQDGIMAKGKSNFRRYTLNLSAEHKLLPEDILRVGDNIVVTHVEKQSVTQNSSTAGPLVGALNMDPLTPVMDAYNPDELYGGYGVSKYVSQEVTNPAARIHYSFGHTIYTTVKGGVFAELTFLKNFKLRSTASADLTYTDTFGYSPMYKLNSTTGNTSANGASQSYSKSVRLNYEIYASWAREFGQHSLSAMAGWSLLQRSSLSMNGSRNNLRIDDEEHAWLSMATATNASAGGGPGNPSAIMSTFARANWSYANRFMATATVRRDGSSRFGAENRYGIFPSASVGWNLDKEAFLSGAGWINALKLRASWGRNGNENIGDFRYLSTISTYGLSYPFGSQDPTASLVPGGAQTTLPNPYLKWETSEQTDLGVDFRFLDMFAVTIDLYDKYTKDLLVTSSIPLFLGNNAPLGNAGNVRNSGIEAGIEFKHQFGKWFISADANIAYNRNMVTYVGTDSGYVSGSTVQGLSGAVTRMEAGHPMSYYWGYKTLGVFQNQSQIEGYVNEAGKQIQPDAVPGDFIFQDTDKDGSITDLDRVDLGNPFPKYTFGFNFSLEAYGFDLNVSTSGQAGFKVFSVLRRMDLPMSNYGAWVINRWHGENTSNSIPRVTTSDINQNFTRPSDFYVKDGDFWRIRNITLGYTVPLPKKLYAKSLRFFASVDNAFCFTRYAGFDPEVGNGGSILGSGIDRGTYPRPRTVTLGAGIKF